MSNKAFIYLRNDSLVIYQWNQNTLQQVLSLSDAENSLEELTDYFNTQNNQPIKIFIDILEESYALQSIPHLGFRDRQAMIERKKNQIFPKLKYTYCEYKGRSDDSERRDDLIFFSAITEEQIIQRWFQLLFEIKVKISGIFSAPILLESLVQQLEGKPNKLIISIILDKQGISIRQNFFQNNSLALSRFKQFRNLNQVNIAEEIREDVNRTQHFISRQFRLSTQNNLSVFFFSSGDEIEAKKLFEEINFSSMSLTPHFMLTHDFAQSQNVVIEKNCGLSAYNAAISAKKRRLKPHYHDDSSYFYYRHFLFKNRLNIASVLVFIASLIYLSNGFLHYSDLLKQVTNLQNRKVTILQSLSQIPQVQLFNDFTSHELFNQLQVWKKINKQALFPQQIMNAISWSLEAFPTIQLTKLEWDGGSGNNNDNLSDGSAFDPSAVTDEKTNSTVKMTLEAKIEPFNGDYRHALKLIKQFSHHLTEHTHISQVVSSSLPVNISRNKNLSGAIQKKNDKIRNTFILQIEWLR